MASLSQNRKHRFNVFDFILIVLVIIVITLTTVKIIRSNPNTISGGDKTAVCVITVSAIPEELKDQINKDDLLYDTESSQLLGKVTDVKYETYKLTGVNEATGDVSTTEVSGKVTLTITFETSVWLEDGTYNIDGYRLSVGKVMSVRTGRVAVSGECSDLTVNDKTA